MFWIFNHRYATCILLLIAILSRIFVAIKTPPLTGPDEFKHYITTVYLSKNFNMPAKSDPLYFDTQSKQSQILPKNYAYGNSLWAHTPYRTISPLYFYSLLPFLNISSYLSLTPFQTDFVLRIPSIIFGMLFVITSYFLGKIIFKSGYLANIMLFFSSMLPIHIFFSATANSDIPLSFFGIMSVVLMTYGIQQKAILYAILAGIFLGTGFLFKQSMMLLIIPIAFTLLLASRKQRVYILIPIVLSIFISSIWLFRNYIAFGNPLMVEDTGIYSSAGTILTRIQAFFIVLYRHLSLLVVFPNQVKGILRIPLKLSTGLALFMIIASLFVGFTQRPKKSEYGNNFLFNLIIVSLTTYIILLILQRWTVLPDFIKSLDRTVRYATALYFIFPFLATKGVDYLMKKRPAYVIFPLLSILYLAGKTIFHF